MASATITVFAVPRSKPTRDDLAAAIRSLRVRSKFTITELAERSGMHETYLSRIERGVTNPTWEKVCALAETLRVEPSEIALEAEAQARRRRRRQRA